VTRLEAVVMLLVSLTLVTSGLFMLFGAYGLLGVGVALTASTLLLFDIKD
jgi:hypothetical protein